MTREYVPQSHGWGLVKSLVFIGSRTGGPHSHAKISEINPGRFEFTFTPKHGSWLNLIEGFFSKFARSVLRHIRVTSKHELKERILAGIDDVNRHPVIHTWSYKLAEAA